jgi:radical SAM superfamily enzyme YgiQ (UPF0313 family)
MLKDLPKTPYKYAAGTDVYEDRLRKISYSKKAKSRREKILLVLPPSPQAPTPGREFLITGPFEGFTYVATLIKKMGFKLEIFDCRMRADCYNGLIAAAKNADIVGIATYCDSFVFLEKAVKSLKKKYPAMPVFLGGPLVTSVPELILSGINADFAVLGEAELTLLELFDKPLRKGFDLAGIKGLAYKKGGEVVVNPPRPQIRNLDNLPILDYTIWPNYESIVANGQIIISSTRGCPQNCSFCFKTLPLLRMKSLKRFEREVAVLKRTTKFNYTWLNDLTFNVDVRRAMEICGILAKYGIKYHCFARVKNVTREFVETLKNTGCQGIWFGVESYSQEILDYNRKNITIGEINNAINLSEQAGLGTRGLFIVGLYGETERSLKAMCGYIKNGSFLPLVKYLVPFPGTSLYEYALRAGKIKDPAAFLRMLSKRRVSDYDDEIVNLNPLDERVLRRYFRKIWKFTKEREKCLTAQP